MGSKYDIEIRIKICDPSNRIDSKYIIDALNIVETALYRSDIEDIEMACSKLGLSEIILDASKERLRRFRHHRLRIYNVNTGSIYIYGLVMATAYFILKNTVGESIKVAYKDSNMHKKLISIFRENISDKVHSIIKNLKRGTLRKKTYDIRDINFDNIDPTEISITMQGKPVTDKKRLVGTFNEEFTDKTEG